MRRKVFAIVLTIITLATILCGCSVIEDTASATIEVIEEIKIKTEEVRFVGITPDGERTIFSNEKGDMWSLENYYADPTDRFIITLHDDVIVDIKVIE